MKLTCRHRGCGYEMQTQDALASCCNCYTDAMKTTRLLLLTCKNGRNSHVPSSPHPPSYAPWKGTYKHVGAQQQCGTGCSGQAHPTVVCVLGMWGGGPVLCTACALLLAHMR